MKVRWDTALRPLCFCHITGPPSPTFLTLHRISFSVSGSGNPSSAPAAAEGMAPPRWHLVSSFCDPMGRARRIPGCFPCHPRATAWGCHRESSQVCHSPLTSAGAFSSSKPAQGRAEPARSAAGSSIFTWGRGGGWQKSSFTSHSHLWHHTEMLHSQLCICMICCACRELCPREGTAAGVTVRSTFRMLPPATLFPVQVASNPPLLAVRSQSLPVACTAQHLSHKPQGATLSPYTDRSTMRLLGWKSVSYTFRISVYLSQWSLLLEISFFGPWEACRQQIWNKM